MVVTSHQNISTGNCFKPPYALVIGFPEGGRPRADVGEYGDFMGTLQQISALAVGEMLGLSFCSTEKRLGTIDCSLDRWQDGGEEI